MSTPRSTPELQKLLHHASWLRELVAPLLAGDDSVEDVLQETFVAALERPPREGTRWRAWLARVAWNRAQRLRREAARRRARETRSARPEAMPAADRVVAEFELQVRLASAILSLEPNAQRAILLRFYEGLPPRAIAAELGVPVTTVKSWIQRGLEKLRAQLASELGAGWRTAFAPLALLYPAAPAAVVPLAAASLGLGVLMQTKLAVGLLALASVGVLAWLASTHSPLRSRDEGEASLARSESLGETGSLRTTIDVAPTVERSMGAALETAVVPSAPVPEVPLGLARLSGRCVDESGAPLAGVEAKLRGWEESTERMNAFRRTRAAFTWSDPERGITDGSGRFVFEFDPPPPYQFALHLQCAGRSLAFVRWDAWERAQRLELGDIVLRRGCSLSGRILDTQGRPQGGVDLRLSLRREPREGAAPLASQSEHHARTEGDGTFRIRELVASGLWDWHVRDRLRHTSEPLAIEAALGEAFFELVLEEAIEGASISGIVVDEAGQPIPGASVGLGAQSERRRETDLDGRWRLEQPRRDSLDPVHLHASAEGFESRLLETQTPWNTDNVRITLTRGIGFEVAAFDAATREPIEEFLLRLFSRDDSLWHVRPWEHRRGAHPGGIARVTGIPRGRYWLVLDPSDARWARSPFLELQVGERMARVEIALQAAAEVTVHVEDREKRPRENSVVTLIESSGATQPLLDAEIESFDAASSLSPPRALRIAEGRTDAQGNVALRAPPRRELSILVRGADHRAEIHAGIALQEGHQTLTLTVAGGARLLGRLSPPEVAEQLWRAAGWHREGPAEAGVLEHTPRVQLARWVEGRYETHPEAERTARVERDGRFEISGIPPGNWKLLLLWSRLTTAASPDGSIARRRGGWRSIRLASIENLGEDEERRIELDRPDLVLAELEGTLIVDGAAISSVDVSIIGKQTGAADPSHVTQEQCATDSAGRFSILLESGVYEVQARILVPRLETSFDLPTNEQVALAPGQALEREFHVASGEVRLRVLDSAGTPVAGLRLYLCSGTFEQRMAFPLTDAEGRTVGRMPAGTWPLLAEKTGPEKPLLVDVGHLKVAGVKPQPEERELRLPASWSGG